MKKYNTPLIGFILFIGIWVGAMSMQIGKPVHDPSNPPTELFTYFDGLEIIVMYILVFISGWSASNQHRKINNN